MNPSTQFEITPQQANALVDVLNNYIDDAAVIFTKQGDGDLVVGFSLALVTISPDGDWEEN